MAHHKSAKKRIRTNEKKRIKNRNYISSIRTAIKKFHTAADAAEAPATVATLMQTAQSLLSKATTKGILHKNNVSRRIGRLDRKMKLVANPAAVEATKAAVKPTKKKSNAKTSTSNTKSTAAKKTKTVAKKVVKKVVKN